jgi:N-acetylmuramoyl-L-alanine amidase
MFYYWGVKKNKKIAWPPKASKTKPIHFSMVLAALALICALAPAALWAGWLKSGAPRPVIVLDPGHGGNDHGARGPSGLLEKDVALSMARALAEALSARYRTVLTRDDDYGLSAGERASTANHERAALFISLHTGGSFRTTTGGMVVYFCAQTARESLPATPLNDTSTGRDLVFWDSVYLRHQTASRRLAQLLAASLKPLAAGAEVQYRAMPLLVLKGADMPAVLIETGYLTNPVDEQKLADPDHIRTLAYAIVEGIDNFLKSAGQ